MQFSFKRIFLILFLLIVIAGVALKPYRHLRARRHVSKTLDSDHWRERYNGFVTAPRTKGAIVFLGNSLTERFDLTAFADSTILNRGISGDFTEGLLRRLDEVISLQPSKLFIEIGVNDIFEKISPDEISENYEQVIQRVKKGSPYTKIYIQSDLPVSNEPSFKPINERIKNQNEQLKKLSDKYGLVYINLYDAFVKDGALNPDLSADGVHVNRAGYAIWKEILIPYLRS